MRNLVLDLAKRAGFPYKPAAIKPGKCLMHHGSLAVPGAHR